MVKQTEIIVYTQKEPRCVKLLGWLLKSPLQALEAIFTVFSPV